MRNFIKPTTTKVIFLGFLLMLSLKGNFTVMNIGTSYDMPTLYGFPLPFYNPAGNFGPHGKYVESNFSIMTFAINFIILYLMSCVIVMFVKKFRKN